MKDQKKLITKKDSEISKEILLSAKITNKEYLPISKEKADYFLTKKVRRKTAKQTADVTKEMFKEIPEEIRFTMTYDNGKEFSWHKVIETDNKITVYFSDPYSPWQRGTSENVNGLLRQFIPKGTDFDIVSAEDLQKYLDLINNRLRKRLGFKTPLEVFEEENKKVAVRGGM